MTAIDVVLKWGPADTAPEAALWLCAQMGVDPGSLGWRDPSEGIDFSGLTDRATGAAADSETPVVDPSKLDDTSRKVRSALASIPKDASLNRHSAAAVIGLSIKHSDSGIAEDVGAALCAEWDKRVNGESLAIFRRANPDYQATKPLGLANIFKLALENGRPGGTATETEDDPDSDFLTPPPRPTEAMFYGLVGDVAAAAAQEREVNRVSVAAAFMSWLSAQIGRDTYIQVGDVRHALQLFTLHTGRTAIAAKGESVSLVKRVDAEIRQSPISNVGEVGLLGKTHDGGLSSREGLTLFVHDGLKIGKDDIPAIEDKRLWIFEPEFQNVIAQGKREGNTLSAALRDVWDGGSIKPATKGGRIWATEPHIALHGCITPFELRI